MSLHALNRALFIGALVIGCSAGAPDDGEMNPVVMGSGGSNTNGNNVMGSSGGSALPVAGSGGSSTVEQPGGTGGSNVSVGGAAGSTALAGAANGGSTNVAGAGGAAGSTEVPLCAAGAVPVSAGRCATGKVTATGSALMIHDFEEPGETLDYLGVFFADGRSGVWFDAHDTTLAPTITLAAEPTTGGPEGNTRALHYHGGAPQGWGATVGIPVANCYDATAYSGVSFYIKGNPGAGNTQVKFSVHTPVSEPVASGGGCSPADEALGRCYDHYAKVIPLTQDWVRHNIKWADLLQNCSANPGYNPGTEILTMSFSILNPAMGFDFWVDNFSFDTGDLPSNSFTDIVSEATFNEMWTSIQGGVSTNLRNPFYTYQGLVASMQNWPAFSTTGTPTQRRREAAAFLSNLAHETGSLSRVEEMGCENDTTCTQYGQAPNGNTYHGRGPIQLSYGYNYEPAGIALNQDLAGNPRLLETDPAVAFGTALWFWMTFQSGKGICHDAIASGGLGATINIINGIECANGNPAAIANRVQHYRRFCAMLGVDPGPGLGC